ncbi:transcriptional regulator Kaiso-like [Neoarius graeffei]|uniref:transcriptional regulator Kaiso-like n=1 Tax=Neoarius graeffei TaxID=443677 RepID=UPI00298BE9EF|nr:transcriptional regulator Kaiso-like [Neoarius graeffei]
MCPSSLIIISQCMQVDLGGRCWYPLFCDSCWFHRESQPSFSSNNRLFVVCCYKPALFFLFTSTIEAWIQPVRTAGMSKLKLISVTDTQFPVSLLEAISEQRNNGLFCDMTIIVQDRKFRAHKTMLSASSTYFRQLSLVAGQVIELNFIKAEIFEEVLNYIYTSKIHHIRSDKLEDLISAGQILGVKFIANLAAPLSQVKGLPGLSKEGETSTVNIAEKNEIGAESMPIITESFSLSAKEFKMVSGSIERDDPDNDDVLFVSELEAPKAQKMKQSQIIDLDVEEGPEPKRRKGTNEEELSPKQGRLQNEESMLPSEGDAPKKFQDNAQPHAIPAAVPMSPSSSDVVMISDARSSTQSAPSTPAHVNSLTPDSLNATLEPSEVLGVQKKVVLLEQSPDRPSRIRLSDVRPTFNTNDGTGLDAALMKKTITLDKASEIDSLSSGCKVYANIGENTYDIVPVKEYSGEGEARPAPGRKSQTSVHGPSNLTTGPSRGKKKGKAEQEDHYELMTTMNIMTTMNRYLFSSGPNGFFYSSFKQTFIELEIAGGQAVDKQGTNVIRGELVGADYRFILHAVLSDSYDEAALLAAVPCLNPKNDDYEVVKTKIEEGGKTTTKHEFKFYWKDSDKAMSELKEQLTHYLLS